MKLSIITINYNNRDGLQKTIDSVVKQTWRDFEWIIIDGGSTDGSKELIEQYQDNFAFWCSEPDKGIYNAMNKGVTYARGEYVNFMNSGDCFHDADVLQKIFEQDIYADILIGKTLLVGNNEIVNKQVEILGKIDLCGMLIGFNHQGMFAKLELLRKHPFDESLKIVSDWKFWWQTIVFDNCSIIYLKVLIADYDTTGISFSEKYNQLKIEERELVLRSFFPPIIYEGIMDYFILYFNSIVQNMMYLKKNNPTAYVVLRKISSFIYRICKWKNRF